MNILFWKNVKNYFYLSGKIKQIRYQYTRLIHKLDMRTSLIIGIFAI